LTGGIAVVGSLNADLVIHVDHAPGLGETVLATRLDRFPGGKGANQACAAARLGVPTRMYGRVGADENGVWLRGQLAAAGVDVTTVVVDEERPTGLAIITVDSAGQNQIVVVPGANAGCDPAPDTTADRPAIEAVLLQLEIPMETVERVAVDASRAGRIVLLDPAPARTLPQALIASTTYLSPNETELAALTGGGAVTTRANVRARARRLIERGVANVVVKLGARGALLVSRDGEVYWPAFEVRVEDTTAAGDAFNAAFAVALIQTGDREHAGDFATAAAAVAVTRAGAQPAMPTRADVARMLETGTRRRPLE
jgi:ribokinase